MDGGWCQRRIGAIQDRIEVLIKEVVDSSLVSVEMGIQDYTNILWVRVYTMAEDAFTLRLGDRGVTIMNGVDYTVQCILEMGTMRAFLDRIRRPSLASDPEPPAPAKIEGKPVRFRRLMRV